jgi:hypothetical protein
MLVLSLILAQMSSERASQVCNTCLFIYLHKKKKRFAEITQDVLVAMLNCQTVRWGSVMILWGHFFPAETLAICDVALLLEAH